MQRNNKEIWSIHRREKKQLIETDPEEAQKLELLDKYFKSAILNLFKELKETVCKQWKESMKMESHIETINR